MPVLDPSKTAAFDLGHGPSSALLLHGLTGTPWEVRPLGELLARQGFRAKGIRLPGHGRAPEALEAVALEDWREAAREALDGLPSRRVSVLGLSMGALLALDLAARFPERVEKLVLLAPAMRLSGLPARLVSGLLPRVPVEMIKPWVDKGSVSLADPKARAEAPRLERFPLARLRDLVALQKLAWAALPRVRASTLVALGKKDDVVDGRAVRRLIRGLRRNAPVEFLELPEASHLLPRDLGHEQLEAAVARFLSSTRNDGGRPLIA